MEKILDAKQPTTILVTQDQMKKIRDESKRTGNSQNSIVRTALDIYFEMREERHFRQ